MKIQILHIIKTQQTMKHSEHQTKNTKSACGFINDSRTDPITLQSWPASPAWAMWPATLPATPIPQIHCQHGVPNGHFRGSNQKAINEITYNRVVLETTKRRNSIVTNKQHIYHFI